MLEEKAHMGFNRVSQLKPHRINKFNIREKPTVTAMCVH